MAANQRNQLICRDQKCDRIYKSNQSQNHKSSQPIRISRCEKFFENAFVVSHFILLTSTRTELQQRSTRMNNPKPVACSRALTLSVMRFSFPAFSQGSSVVEQGTHKPLVGTSTLPPGSVYPLGLLHSRVHRPTLQPLILTLGFHTICARTHGNNAAPWRQTSDRRRERGPCSRRRAQTG